LAPTDRSDLVDYLAVCGLGFVAMFYAKVSARAPNQVKTFGCRPQVCEVVWTQAARKAQGVGRLGHGVGLFHRRNRMGSRLRARDFLARRVFDANFFT
jgi:hypothetical protein